MIYNSFLTLIVLAVAFMLLRKAIRLSTEAETIESKIHSNEKESERKTSSDSIQINFKELQTHYPDLFIKGLDGINPDIKKAHLKIIEAANSDATVLITGDREEIELAAHLIHLLSSRRHMSFIVVNCAAMPAPLIESELYGYIKGAFVGAYTEHEGVLFKAEGGVLLLDNIDFLPPNALEKLASAIQNKAYQKLGRKDFINFNVRVIGSVCNSKLVGNYFSKVDLLSISIPSLKDRTEDIPLLLADLESKFGLHHDISFKLYNDLKRYNWPVNLEELIHLAKRLAVPENTEKRRYNTILSSYIKPKNPIETENKELKDYLTEIEIKAIKDALYVIEQTSADSSAKQSAVEELMREHKFLQK